MKYQVQIKYTNPAHEHVSLRRRVETITRLVEASNETEAINRAANQQRSLGYMIKEAEVLKPDVADKTEPKDKKKKKVVGDDTENTDVAAASGSVKEDSDKKDDKETKRLQDKLESGRMSPSEVEKKLKKESYPLLKPGQKIKAIKLKMKEGFDPEPSDIAAQLVKKHGKGKVTKDHVDAYERDRDSNKAIDKEAVMKHVQKMSEEVEQLSEGPSHYQYSGTIHSNVGNAKHGEEKDDGHSYSITIPTRGVHQGDLGSFLSSKKAFSKISRENPHLEPHHVLAIMHGTGDDVEDVEVDHKGKTYKHRLYNTQEPDYLYEEVELDEAQKKLRPSYWKAEWRLGTQSEVDKNNKKIFDKLAKTDPVKASAFHDNLMRMRKKDMKEEVEQVDEGLTAKKTAVRASDLSDKFKKKDPEKSKLYRDVTVKAISRIKTGVGQSSQGSYRDVEGGGNKALRRQGIQPAGKSPVFPFRKEEVDQVDEGVATAQKVMDRANVVAKTNPDPKKRFAAGGLANKAMMRTINPTGVNTGITRGGGNKAYRKITGKAPPHQLTKKTGVSEEVVAEASKEGKDVMRGMRASLKSMDLRHGVDSDKREAGYKMSPAVKAAQVKSDALSKVVKRPQAGTIAAVHRSMERQMQKESVEYIEEKLTAADPASKWIHDFVKSDNPKFAGKSKKERINMALGAHYAAKRAKNEEIDLDESKHEGKKESRKAGEKREDILQGKVNKINMTPELDQKINGVK